MAPFRRECDDMRTSRRRGSRWALPVTALASAAAGLAALGTGGAGAAVRPAVGTAGHVPAQYLRAPRYAAAGGQYVSFLFSKTEQTAADNCVPDDSGIARLDTTVAPYLQSFGMIGTGTLITAKTQNSVPLCTH